MFYCSIFLPITICGFPMCFFSIPVSNMFCQAHWWQKLRSSRPYNLGAYKVFQFGLFGHFGTHFRYCNMWFIHFLAFFLNQFWNILETHFLAYELSITYMGMSPQRSSGMWDVDIRSPGVIRINEPRMNRSSARQWGFV